MLQPWSLGEVVRCIRGTISTLGLNMFIISIVCQACTERWHTGCSVPLMGKGASLPSVAGSAALQPCVGRLKQSIIIEGNKHQLPAKSWSALSVASRYSCAANHFGSRNVEIFLLSKHHSAGKKKKKTWKWLFGRRLRNFSLHSIKGGCCFGDQWDWQAADPVKSVQSFNADLNITCSNLFYACKLSDCERGWVHLMKICYFWDSGVQNSGRWTTVLFQYTYTLGHLIWYSFVH